MMSCAVPKKTKSLSDNSESEEEQERSTEYGKGGYRKVKIGETLCEDRYDVIRKLGWGTFSTVWLCADRKFDDYAAIKIMKSKKSYSEAALEEIKMLSEIKSADTKDPFGYRVVTLMDHFSISAENGRHHCLVFEVMGDSLFKFLKNHFKYGIPVEGLKLIARHVLEGLTYLHTKCRLIHTDIKPENILLTIDKKRVKQMDSEVKNLIGICGESQLPDSFVAAIEDRHKCGLEDVNKTLNRKMFESFDGDLSGVSVKIADLGCAVYLDQFNDHTIQTRPYRSPEVILGSPYGTSADIWSTGCMFFELATGETLLDYKPQDKRLNKNELLLSRIIELLGPIPRNCRKGRHYSQYFTKSGRLYSLRTINQIHLDRLLIDLYKWEPTLAESFVQFLLPLLEIDPKKRSSAEESLSHRWLDS